MRKFLAGCIATLAYMVLVTPISHALPIELITNGGFETGDFTGWGASNTGSSFGFGINDGTFDPAGPGAALAPISGSFDAVSSQTGPGQNNLFQQSILLPGYFDSIQLSWSDRIRNYGSVFSDPNQEFRVILLDSAGALISEIFSTTPGDPLQQIGPNNRSFDLTATLAAFAGQSIDVRFEQQDNLGFFNATIDNVSLIAQVPEPPVIALMLLGLFAIGYKKRLSAHR